MFTLHGVDVYIWSPETPQLPDQIGRLKLTLISNRGTRIWPPPAPEIDLLDWPRCRFVCDEEVSHDEIDEVVLKITSLGFRWSKCQKLYRDGTTNLYSEAY